MSLSLLAVFPVLLGLLALGFPVFIVLLITTAVAISVSPNVSFAAVHQNLFSGLYAPALLAVPFFIFAGEIMGRGSFANRLVDLMRTRLAGTRGGLGMATVAATAVFGAISGASAAAVATIGRAMYPAMRNAGYPAPMAAGLVTSVGAIDILIPPSIPMIIYGLAASQSVPRLYLAGVVPGLLIAALLAVCVRWQAVRSGVPHERSASARERYRALRRSGWALGAPFIVLGGIYGGVLSPTESAAAAAVWAIGVTRWVYRELSWGEILAAARRTALFTAQVLLIFACANALSWVMTVNQVPDALVHWVDGLDAPAWTVLLAMNLLLLAAGCVLDPMSSILMLSPLLLPIVTSLGMDPLHFGVVLMVNLAIGMFHPPFGVNVFVAQSVLRIPLQTIYRGILPFVGVYLLALGLITYVPALSLALPNAAFGA